MTTTNQLRQSFIEYFKLKDHKVLASSPLVPQNDPSLMFTNAGMVQFKDIFTGNEKSEFSRAVTSQKCVRAGGKHNDLENVGYTARHHTFFEMLGNFSFGDYFKEEAINYAWEFLTKVIELPKEKLVVTVFHDDDEAYNLWKKISGFSDDKIIRIATKDNFWSMGDVGPCGPCSEVFYDHGEQIFGGLPGSKDEDGDRFIEIWNLVFMQYQQIDADKRINLPKPSIDTGMGLERLAAILQGVHDNYDIDLFKNLIKSSIEFSGNNDKKLFNSHKVIADHLRSCCFLLADGVMPSNEGRGYVLRRIMRRAMRHAHLLGCNEPLIYKLVPSLIKEMGDAYPELSRSKSLSEEILKQEEEKFKTTLDRGLKLLDEEKEHLKSGDKLNGDFAFKLYDTYGFPLDLTRDILRSENIKVDEKGFEDAMAQQKQRARAAWQGSGQNATEEVWFELFQKSGATEFTGYKNNHIKAKIIAIVKDGQQVANASSGDEISVILNQTPFYGESGGQQGDKGTLSNQSLKIAVNDTQKKFNSLHIHQCKLEQGTIKIGDLVDAQIDDSRRLLLKANHSATHILHSVLRKILGDHVTQKGSMVAQDRLRFDISHPKPISYEQLQLVEQQVNNIIQQNSPVGTKLMTPDDAINAGALALFGEKYGDEVRVVNMGLDKTQDYSVELCGGTHVDRTGDIGFFKIISESAVAAGIRRIEAQTGLHALSYISNVEQKLNDVSLLLKTSNNDAALKVESLISDRKSLEKEIKTLKNKIALGGGGGSNDGVEKINNINFIGKNLQDISAKDLRSTATQLLSKIKSGIVAVACSYDGKVSFIVTVSNDLTEKYNAVEIVKSLTEILGSKGAGGKPNFAQTGGNLVNNIDNAIAQVKELIDS